MTTKERTKIERILKQKSKEQVKSQGSNSTTTTSSSIDSPSSSIKKSTVNSIEKKQTSIRFASFLKCVKKYPSNNDTTPKTISEEISLYSSLCRKHATMDALIFWKTFGDQIPLLKDMAQRYLGTPATSVRSESAFSSSAYIGRKERARLSPENLCYTVFVQDKLRSSMDF